MSKDVLVIFTRYPIPGATKTRLIPALGESGAAELHRRMVEHTIGEVRQLSKETELLVEVQYTGATRELLASWLGTDLELCEQVEGDLGKRMSSAFSRHFRNQTERMLIIGTDCPQLSVKILKEAFNLLVKHDVVIGPAYDGGYYLIGLRQPVPELFDNVPWGTAEVLSCTVDIVNRFGLSYALLEQLHDVDRPSDLKTLRKHLSYPLLPGNA